MAEGTFGLPVAASARARFVDMDSPLHWTVSTWNYAVMARWQRPVRAADLFATPEMQLRFSAERELRREGFDEGHGHGFDNMDTSPLASRTIASTDAASEVVDWFVDRLSDLGWTDRGEGPLRRDDEWILLRVERDRGVSRVASIIQDENGRAMQDSFERAYYSGAAVGFTIVTIFYGVTPS